MINVRNVGKIINYYQKFRMIAGKIPEKGMELFGLLKNNEYYIKMFSIVNIIGRFYEMIPRKSRLYGWKAI